MEYKSIYVIFMFKWIYVHQHCIYVNISAERTTCYSRDYVIVMLKMQNCFLWLFFYRILFLLVNSCINLQLYSFSGVFMLMTSYSNPGKIGEFYSQRRNVQGETRILFIIVLCKSRDFCIWCYLSVVSFMTNFLNFGYPFLHRGNIHISLETQVLTLIQFSFAYCIFIV